MEIDEELHRLFLVQMRELEQFRISYTGANPDLPLEQGDQDVQRMIEALAFFSARTRRAAERTMAQSTERLFAQHFPFLLAPVPAAAMMEVRVDGRFVDPADLRPGEEVLLDPHHGAGPDESSLPPLVFRTTRAHRILPLRLDRVVLDRRGRGRGAALELSFDALHRRRWPVGRLALQVDHLGELSASAAVHHALHQSFLGAEVRWDGGHDRARCPVSFMPLPRGSYGPGAVEHPLQRARDFFRLPEQDLQIVFDVPPPPGEWVRFSLRLELSDAFPRGLNLTDSTFRLHVLPLINLRRELAAPIEIDGTRESDWIEHPDPLGGHMLHSVQGVYEMDRDEGLVPILPGFVPQSPAARQGAPVWEVDLRGRAQRRSGQLRMVAPQAFETALRVAVDAWWHQPERAAEVPLEAAVRLADRFLEGLELELLGRVRQEEDAGLEPGLVGRVLPAMDSTLDGDQEAQLALLAARSRRTLRLPELQLLLGVLRGRGEANFHALSAQLSGCEVRAVPSAMAAGGFRYDYILTFDGVEESAVPLLVLLGRRLAEVLATWSSEEVVGVTVRLPNLDQILDFRGEERWR